jgi:hypothetical protein
MHAQAETKITSWKSFPSGHVGYFEATKSYLEEMTFLEIMLVLFPLISRQRPPSSSTCWAQPAFFLAKLGNIRKLVQVSSPPLTTSIMHSTVLKMIVFLQKTYLFSAPQMRAFGPAAERLAQ